MFKKDNYTKGARVDVSSIDMETLPYCTRTVYAGISKEKRQEIGSLGGKKTAALGISQANGKVMSKKVCVVDLSTGECFIADSRAHAGLWFDLNHSYISALVRSFYGYNTYRGYMFLEN